MPPPDGWWACASGITACVNLKLLNDTQKSEYCILVQLVPRLIYHPYEELLDAWDPDKNSLIRPKRELGITLSILLGVGLGAIGTAAGFSAIALQQKGYGELRMAIDTDIERTEGAISKMQESLTSLSEVALQNRRGLDLLFLQQGGLCTALREECCFYIDHAGAMSNSMAKVREGLVKRKHERELSQGWFERWFNSSPSLTTLIFTLLGPLIILLLLFTFGPCILN